MKHQGVWAVLAVGLAAALTAALAPIPAQGAAATDAPARFAAALTEVAHDESPPLRDIDPGPLTPKIRGGVSSKPRVPPSRVAQMKFADVAAVPVSVDVAEALPAMPALDVNFAGMDNPNGYYPPDTVGDIGPSHYIEMVNTAFAVYGRDGTVQYGPADINTLWTGFGGACEQRNDGDPIVNYDELADRWVLSQFALPEGADQLECVAVSATGDPMGTYYRYAFSYGTAMPDYPKMSVWPDGYYVTFNMFGPPPDWTYLGVKVCALERAAMLQGLAARQQCSDLPEQFSLLPSDVDGATPPPVGTPNYILGEHWSDPDKLTMFRYQVDWDVPANTLMSAPVTIGVDPFTWACLEVDRNLCVPQPACSPDGCPDASPLDSLGGRMLYRLAYRNFGDHESLLATHVVATDGNPGLTSQTGTGWFEVRSPGVAPYVYQQGTAKSADASTFQWMGSAAMDRQGNIALGYSSSNATTVFPSINYVGRLATDPLGTMPYTEGTIKVGAGIQFAWPGRWGDYTSMQVDPLDDCTFWYANEYMKRNAEANWSTQIAAFRFPGCTGSSSTPTAPATVGAVPGDETATVVWTPPADNGGLPVVAYTATVTPSGASCSTVVGATANPRQCEITGLTNGTSYVVDVTARNALGVSSASTTGPVVPVSPSSGGGTPQPSASPQPTPSPDTTPVPSSVLTVTTPTGTTFAPRTPFGVRIDGGTPGCRVNVSIASANVIAVFDAGGGASTQLNAPLVNRVYPLTARQSGPGCEGITGSENVRVVGPYVVGPMSPRLGAAVTYKARAFAPGRTVTWSLVRGGKEIDTAKATATRAGSSSFDVVLDGTGRYTVIALQGSSRATLPVRIVVPLS